MHSSHAQEEIITRFPMGCGIREHFYEVVGCDDAFSVIIEVVVAIISTLVFHDWKTHQLHFYLNAMQIFINTVSEQISYEVIVH